MVFIYMHIVGIYLLLFFLEEWQLNCNSHDTLKPVSNIQTSLDCCVFFIIIIIITIAIIIIKHTWNENNHVSIQHINLYKFSEVTASIIKYTSILIVNYLQELRSTCSMRMVSLWPMFTEKKHSLEFILTFLVSYH